MTPLGPRPRVVIDSSVLVDVLAGAGAAADRARDAVAGRRWTGPAHLRVEAFHAVRGLLLGRRLESAQARRAVRRLGLVDVDLVPTASLLTRMWELRANLTGYEAAYVAVAEHLAVPLVTGDRRLAAAPGLRCEIVLA